jgi:enterochelin esterase-like enzyme
MNKRVLVKSVCVGAIIAFAGQSAFAQRSRVERGQITSPALATSLLHDPVTRLFAVYLPPSYDLSQKRYPSIYVLHGFPEDENELLAGLKSSMDSLISGRRIVEMIAVFVNTSNRLGGSFCLSSPVIGDYETYIATDLVNLVDTQYRTLPARESRGIHGFSIGGFGAMHLALKFPSTFSVVVAESGTYDSRSPANDSWARQLAYAHPTTLAQAEGLTGAVQGMQAWFAGLLPNPQRPPIFTDYVYEWTNGQPTLVQSAHKRCLQNDVQNGDILRYTNQLVRLTGIKIVHGAADSVIPISEARSFTNALGNAAIPFAYQEHSGDHVYQPQLALPFFSTNLVGGELYISPPQLSLVLTNDQVQVSFPTQSQVRYTIEVTASLSSEAGWTAKTNFIGSGVAVMSVFPKTDRFELFRVNAINSP